MTEVRIDGSYGEGGGQILRTSLAMSSLTSRPVRIENIRAGRKKPGLAAQHLTAIRAIASLMNARVEGDRIGSKEIFFSPGAPREGDHELDVGTAGAVTLILQTVLPVALVKEIPARFLVTGGTDVPWSPVSAYFEDVYCHFLDRMGCNLASRVLAHGFFPRGGGLMEVTTAGMRGAHPLDLANRGGLTGIFVTSIASDHLRQAKVAERQIEGFSRVCRDHTVERSEYVDARSPGCFVFAKAVYGNTVLGASALGERGKRAEAVGSDCAHALELEMNGEGTLDVHMSDQVLPFLALMGGTVKTREIMSHTMTNAQVLREFGYEITIAPPAISSPGVVPGSGA
jgi:RNA 3'-phosphate cyclase